jgi:TDG/mug DNA glycosylase family protein
MRVLVCGLNPSLVSADAGYGYAGVSNRFWRAAVGSGLVATSRARQPLPILAEDHVGMTDLVKRATPRADGLTAAEYHAGLARVAGLARWLQPALVVFVGLAGWRAAVDRGARAGIQAPGAAFGNTPVYLMPSTSGANASSSLAELIDHLVAAQASSRAGN